MDDVQNMYHVFIYTNSLTYEDIVFLYSKYSRQNIKWGHPFSAWCRAESVIISDGHSLCITLKTRYTILGWSDDDSNQHCLDLTDSLSGNIQVHWPYVTHYIYIYIYIWYNFPSSTYFAQPCGDWHSYASYISIAWRKISYQCNVSQQCNTKMQVQLKTNWFYYHITCCIFIIVFVVQYPSMVIWWTISTFEGELQRRTLLE